MSNARIAGTAIGGFGGAVAGAFAMSAETVRNSSLVRAMPKVVDDHSFAIGALAGGLLGALGGYAATTKAANSGMADAEKKVDNVRLKMAQIASKALWRTMGRPGDVPWWFKDVRIAQDRDGNYFLKGIISDKLPMDDTGWPYGLPHTSEGVKVVAERQDPNSVEPVKLGPI